MGKMIERDGWMIAVHGVWSLRRLWRGLLVLIATPAVLQAANWRPLPDSGQAKCYDITGKEIVCPPAGQSLHGQDGQYHGTASAYHDNGNQTVTDTNSGLVWMKSDDGTARAWQDAVAYCQGLDFGGLTDWRLPTKFELNSIVDYGRSFPAIDPVFQCKSSFYWSDLVYGDDPAYAWGAFFNDGGDHWLDKVNKYYARCVRGDR